jgi:hypothetical protein
VHSAPSSRWNLAALIAAVALGCGWERGPEDDAILSAEAGEFDDAHCEDLDAEACAAEPGCEPLWGTVAYDNGGEVCLVEEKRSFLDCQLADTCEAPSCLARKGPEGDLLWVEECSCLEWQWTRVGATTSKPAPCPCSSRSDCESWQDCREGHCTEGCFDSLDDCTCSGPGSCPPGYCCGWELYCLAGAPEPDGHCPYP